MQLVMPDPAPFCTVSTVHIARLCAESLLVVAVAVVLSSANAVGFTKCSKEAKQSMTNMATSALRSHLTGGLGRMNPFGGGS